MNPDRPVAEVSAPAEPARDRPWRRAALGLGLGLLACVLLLAVVELGLAGFGVGEGGRNDDPFVGFSPGSPLFEKRTAAGGAAVYATRPEKLGFFNEQTFPAEKSEGTYRIFALGGSTTYGRPYDHRVSFAHQLQLYLDAADPSRRWEVINAGGISYASYRIAVLMRELARYEPDLFVLYTGHNEFLEERTYSDILDQNPAWRRFRMWLSGFRFAALARRGFGAGAAPGGSTEVTLAPEVATRLESWTGLEAYERDDALRTAVIEHFRFNLGRLAEMAQDADAGMVMVVPVSNLKDFSPFKSQPSAALAAGAAERFAAAMVRASAAGDPATARSALEQAVALDPQHAGARFELGRARLALGDAEAASADLTAAKDLDVAPLRAISALEDAVRSVARARSLPLIDLPAKLAAEAPQRFAISQAAARIPGDELLLDHVHLDVGVHGLIAEEVVETLIADGTVRPVRGWTASRRSELTAELVASFDRSYYAERDLNLAKVLGWAGKLEEAEAPLLRAAEVLGDHPDLRLNLGILYQRTGRAELALPELERAVALSPGSPQAHFNLGVTRGRVGQTPAAIEALRRAVELQPDYAEAHHNLGVMLRESGDLRASEGSLRRALELSPGTPAVHRALALTLYASERFDEARAEAAKAGDRAVADLEAELAALDLRSGRAIEAERRFASLAREKPSAEIHAQHGMALRALGRAAEARAAYERALALDPGHAQSHNNLGVLLAGGGELPAARQHLEEAVRLAPGYADAWLNLGVVLDQSAQPQAAAEAVERAVALDPANRRYRRALGLLYTALGDSERAREHLELAGGTKGGER